MEIFILVWVSLQAALRQNLVWVVNLEVTTRKYLWPPDAKS